MVSLLQTLIAAIDNAEAVDATQAEGVTEVARRHLTEDDLVAVIRSESSELRRAADEYERRGSDEEARRLRSLAVVADRYGHRFADGP